MYIYKTPAGTWAFRVDIGTDSRTGKRRQKSRQGFQRKKDAEAAARKVLLDVQKAAYIPNTPITIKDFITQWLERYAPTVKESTLRTRITAAHALENELGAVPIQKLTLPMYQSCINRLAGKYARSTLVLFNGFARMLMKDARQYGLIQKDPTEFVKLPRPDDSPEERLPAYLNREQLKTFLQCAREYGLPQDYPMFFLLAYTGLRIGEAMALCWEDVDFEEGTIRVNKTLYHVHKQYKVTSPKTRLSRRTIEVSPEVLAVLKEQRYYQIEAKLYYGAHWYNAPETEQGFVFTSRDNPGRPTNATLWQAHLSRILARSPGLPYIHPHSFRHTHASLLAEAGASLEEISDRLGHSRSRTTTLIYLHVTQKRRREVAEKFARFMGL